MEEVKALLKEPIELICCVLIVIMAFSVLIGVIDRFAIHKGLAWTFEVSRYSFVWAQFLAAAVVTKKKSHFVVNIVPRKLPAKTRKIWMIVIQIACLVISIIIVIKATYFTVKIGSIQFSPVLQIQMSYVYAAVPVSFSFMAYYFGRQIIQSIKDSEE